MKKKIKNNFNKIGILGGTFDPPHEGHLYISKKAIKKLKLDKIIWIVTKKNPLKKNPYLSKRIRIKLCKNFIKKQKKISVNNLNISIKSDDTFSLLKYFKKKYKGKKLFFLMGADNLIKFHKWYKWNQIPELAKIVIFSRKSYSVKALNSTAAKKLKKNDWLYVNSRDVNISSSLIRKVW